jgi:hypothetical protein
MTTESELLQDAIEGVGREQSLIRTEQRRFEAFREAVSRTTPEPAGAKSASSETTAPLVDTYRETVMTTPDFEIAYDESLEESLQEELSPALADTLLANAQLTQKRKRDLLVQTNAAIDRRERFLAELERERDALETTAAEVADIRSRVEELPECSPRLYPLEELLDIWDVYTTLEQQCERLLDERQQQLRGAEWSGRPVGKQHVRNEYLYGDLETSYPVLSILAETVERINENRTGSETSIRSPSG